MEKHYIGDNMGKDHDIELDFLDNYSCLYGAVTFLSFCAASSDMSSGRRKSDFLADRLAVASNESNLFKCLTKFKKSLNVGVGKEDVLFKVSKSKFSDSILRLIREYPVEVTALIFTKKDDKEEKVLNLFDFVDFKDVEYKTIRKRNIEIPILITLTDPLVHGDENKQGNAILFRRRKTSTGMMIPFYSANSLGHKLRVLLAEDYLRRIGLHPSTTSRNYKVWFSEFMHNGNKLGAASKEFCKRIGGTAAGSIKSDGMIELRNMIPFVSLMGGNAKGSFEGRIMIKDLRPICREWGTGEQRCSDLLSWEFGTTPDPFAATSVSKSEAKKKEELGEDAQANSSMIYKFQVLSAGAELEGGFNISSHATDIERSCLGHGIDLLMKHGHLGGKTNKGYGGCNIVSNNAPDPGKYIKYIEENKDEMNKYINDIGAY